MDSSQSAVSAPPSARSAFPVGTIVLLAYLGMMLLSMPFQVFGKSDGWPIGPYLLPPLAVNVYALATMIALGVAIYGILRRQPWGRTAAMVWLLAVMAITGISTVLSLLYPEQALKLTTQLTQHYLAKHMVSEAPASARSLAALERGARAGYKYALITGVLLTWVPNIIAIIYLRRQNGFFRSSQ